VEKVIFFLIYVSSVIIVFVITVGIIIALNKVLAEDCGLSRTGINYKGMSLYLFCLLHELAGRLIQLDLKCHYSKQPSFHQSDFV